MKRSDPLPHLGFGLGLRPQHYPHIFEHWPAVDWFEVISENFMDTDGKPRRNLARIRERYPVVMHGVALSIGTVDPLDSEYLTKLKALIDWLNPAWVSDHLCWTGVAHRNSHDLLPVPYTEEALAHIVSRIKQVQDFLERPIALENPSTYLEFKSSAMGEAEFIARMAEESGCNLLLDVNNVYVSCYNHRLDPIAYLDQLPLDRVIQMHLSGHSNKGTHIIDTHDDHVIDEVWALYKYVVHRAGRVPNTMVEWDDNIPEFSVLYDELGKAKLAAADAANYAPLPDLAKAEIPSRSNHIVPLGEQQQVMLDAVMHTAPEEVSPDSWIKPKERFSPAAQLEVYENAYRFRLHDVVAEDYPALEHYLGSSAFHEIMKAFVTTHMPNHFNIARFATKFPDFYTQRSPEDVFGYELAVLETAITQLSDPAETQPLTSEHLSGISAEALMSMRLMPRTALALLHSRYPINDYYNAFMNEDSPKMPQQRDSYLAVFRHEDVIWRMALEAKEYALLNLLFAGKTIGEALETMAAQPDVDEVTLETSLSTWFGRWIRNGMLAAPDSALRHAA